MKFALTALLASFALMGCTDTLYTHKKDFRPSKPKGPWNDYEKSVRKGEQPEAPKEKK